MKVRVNADKCQGHAMCWLACRDIFRLSDEDGHAYVTDQNVPENLKADVETAMLSCPEQAIEIY